MTMETKNIRIAKQVLDGATLDNMAEETGLHRSRIGQITIDFCRENFLSYQLCDGNGNMRNLKGLRKVWRDMLIL